eukprot:gene39104-44332_t
MIFGARIVLLCIVAALCTFLSAAASTYDVKVVKRPSTTVISNIDGTTSFTLVFNPSWVEASDSTGGKSGLLMRTQNCTINPGDACSFCGGSAASA